MSAKLIFIFLGGIAGMAFGGFIYKKLSKIDLCCPQHVGASVKDLQEHEDSIELQPQGQEAVVEAVEESKKDS